MKAPTTSQLARKDAVLEASQPYHQPLALALEPLHSSIQKGRAAINTAGEKRVTAETAAAETAVQVQLVHGESHGLRTLGKDAINRLADIGEQIYESGLDRQQRQSPTEGLILNSGSRIVLPEDLGGAIAETTFATHQLWPDRLGFTLPALTLEKGARVMPHTLADNWDNLDEVTRRKFAWKTFQLALGVADLRERNADLFSLLTDSVNSISSSAGTITPYAKAFDAKFQSYFAFEQASTAWAWRKMLEPNPVNSKPPELSPETMLFRNQISVLILEYLPALGREALDFMRDYGKEMISAPFLRTEIKEDHLHEYMTGIPLIGGGVLEFPLDLACKAARDHHSAWRTARRLIEFIPEKNYHQPPRESDTVWDKVAVHNHNRDILNVYGICFMLAKMPEEKFQVLRRAAQPGNPFGFELYMGLSS